MSRDVKCFRRLLATTDNDLDNRNATLADNAKLRANRASVAFNTIRPNTGK